MEGERGKGTGRTGQVLCRDTLFIHTPLWELAFLQAKGELVFIEQARSPHL